MSDLAPLMSEISDVMASSADELAAAHAKVASLQAEKETLQAALTDKDTALQSALAQCEATKKASAHALDSIDLDNVLDHAERAGLLHISEKSAAIERIRSNPLHALANLVACMAPQLASKQAAAKGQPVSKPVTTASSSREAWCPANIQ